MSGIAIYQELIIKIGHSYFYYDLLATLSFDMVSINYSGDLTSRAEQ